MVVFESTKVRRLVGRLERGESVPEAFRRVAKQHGVEAAWVRGLGAFEWAEICEYDQREQRYRPAHRVEACEILSLEGNLSRKGDEVFAHLHVTLSREHGAAEEEGLRVYGGHLVAGRVFALEFSLECYDDVALERVADSATGLSLWREEAPAAPSAPAASGVSSGGGAMSWAQVAAASASAREEPARPAPSTKGERGRRGRESRTMPVRTPAPTPDPIPTKKRQASTYMDEHYPEKGDWVDHARFGLCRVDGETPDGGLLIKLPSGARKTIKLDYLVVGEPRDENGTRVFPVGPKKPRS